MESHLTSLQPAYQTFSLSQLLVLLLACSCAKGESTHASGTSKYLMAIFGNARPLILNRKSAWKIRSALQRASAFNHSEEPLFDSPRQSFRKDRHFPLKDTQGGLVGCLGAWSLKVNFGVVDPASTQPLTALCVGFRSLRLCREASSFKADASPNFDSRRVLRQLRAPWVSEKSYSFDFDYL